METPLQEDKRVEQSVTVEEVGPTRKALVIEIPEKRIAGKLGETFDTLQSDANVPGFRRGRVPRRLLEKRFGRSVRDEAKAQLIGESYSQAIEDEKIQVLGEPEVKDLEDLELPDSGPMTVRVEMEVVPSFDLPPLEGIEVKKPKLEVEEEQVDRFIDMYRYRMGQIEPAEGPDVEVSPGDLLNTDVKIEYEPLESKEAGDEGEKDEQAEGEGDEPGVMRFQDEQVAIPSEPDAEGDRDGQIAGVLVPAIDEKFKGKKVGDTVTLEMTGPSLHENQDIRDRPIKMTVQIKELAHYVLASAEDIAEALGFENVDVLRNSVREQLKGDIEARVRESMHNQVLDHLVEQVDFPLPERLSEEEASRLLYRRAMDMAYQGASEDEVKQAMAEMRASTAEEARVELKRFFILERAADELDVEVDPKELNGAIANMARRENRRPDRVREDLQKTGRLQQLYVRLREIKTLDKILEKADVKEVDPQELEAAQGEAEAGDSQQSGEAGDKKKKASAKGKKGD